MYIAWFSCGVTSAVACKMAIEKFGAELVEPVYIEIESAHEDNERFILDCEKWMGKKVKRITNPKQFTDQFHVIEKTRFINGPNGAACTDRLKKQARYMFEKENSWEGQIFGFEYSKKEVNRAVRFAQQYPHTKPFYPLIERKTTKKQCMELLLLNGIKPPKMYELGYHNNNCIGCVKGGKGYWNKIREDFPEVFDKMAALEESVGNSCIKGTPLKELKPGEGKHEPPVLPDCGTFCEIEFADIIDPITEDIIEGRKHIGQLSLF